MISTDPGSGGASATSTTRPSPIEQHPQAHCGGWPTHTATPVGCAASSRPRSRPPPDRLAHPDRDVTRAREPGRERDHEREHERGAQRRAQEREELVEQRLGAPWLTDSGSASRYAVRPRLNTVSTSPMARATPSAPRRIVRRRLPDERDRGREHDHRGRSGAPTRACRAGRRCSARCAGPPTRRSRSDGPPARCRGRRTA